MEAELLDKAVDKVVTVRFYLNGTIEMLIRGKLIFQVTEINYTPQFLIVNGPMGLSFQGKDVHKVTGFEQDNIVIALKNTH